MKTEDLSKSQVERMNVSYNKVSLMSLRTVVPIDGLDCPAVVYDEILNK